MTRARINNRHTIMWYIHFFPTKNEKNNYLFSLSILKQKKDQYWYLFIGKSYLLWKWKSYSKSSSFFRTFKFWSDVSKCLLFDPSNSILNYNTLKCWSVSQDIFPFGLRKSKSFNSCALSRILIFWKHCLIFWEKSLICLTPQPFLQKTKINVSWTLENPKKMFPFGLR